MKAALILLGVALAVVALIKTGVLGGLVVLAFALFLAGFLRA